VCVLWLFVEAAGGNGLCGESNTRAKAFVAATEIEREIAQPNAIRGKALLVSRVVETTLAEQKQTFQSGREKSDVPADRLAPIRKLAAAQGKAAHARQSTPAREQNQALEHEQECDRAEVLARALTSSLREELDALWSAAEVARIKQKQALEQERDRADRLARELTSLRAELDTARAARRETAQSAEAAGIEQELAFERDKSETLARELASARKDAEERSAHLAAAHTEALQVTETNRAVAGEQKLALASERDRADALARELASVRNELEAGNRQIAALNALHALQPRERAVDGSQEPTAASASRTAERKGPSPEQVSTEGAGSTSGPSSASESARPEAQPTAREAASDPEPIVAMSSSRTTEGKEPSPDQISAEAGSTSGLSSAPVSARPAAQSTAREAASDPGPKVAMGTEQSTSASAAFRTLVDEERLLARANALLRQGDIGGARLLLEHALERGSARAAFMLAETYDARVLRSWRTHGVSGDLAKARGLYERAQAGGIEDAKERIETLK
jgi:hypothetical protein